MRQKKVTKCDRLLITKCDKMDCKVHQELQRVLRWITKCDGITKCGGTVADSHILFFYLQCNLWKYLMKVYLRDQLFHP